MTIYLSIYLIYLSISIYLYLAIYNISIYLRFDMRVYEEKRKHELSDLEEHLKIEYDKSLKDAEARENQIKG